MNKVVQALSKFAQKVVQLWNAQMDKEGLKREESGRAHPGACQQKMNIL